MAKESRLDVLIAEKFEGVSRSQAQKLIKDGKVTVDGEAVTSKNMKFPEDADIRVDFAEEEEPEILGEDLPLDIVYEDDHILVVDKPRGMLVHPTDDVKTGTLVNALIYHCGDNLAASSAPYRPGIVHRIDKDTSGLLVVAKTDEAYDKLSRDFQVHNIYRKYRALVRDNIKEEKGTIDAPIGRDPKNGYKRRVDFEKGRPAITHYKVLERFGTFTYVEALLETGRTHQIRVHMAYIHHPLVGDWLYGPSGDGQYLHASALGFTHPATGEYMMFLSEPPKYFTDYIKNRCS